MDAEDSDSDPTSSSTEPESTEIESIAKYRKLRLRTVNKKREGAGENRKLSLNGQSG